MNALMKQNLLLKGERRCQDDKHRGERHWYRITGLRGWERAAKRLPAWGMQWPRNPAGGSDTESVDQASKTNL